jgi:hypothetical protein
VRKEAARRRVAEGRKRCWQGDRDETHLNEKIAAPLNIFKGPVLYRKIKVYVRQVGTVETACYLSGA